MARTSPTAVPSTSSSGAPVHHSASTRPRRVVPRGSIVPQHIDVRLVVEGSGRPIRFGSQWTSAECLQHCQLGPGYRLVSATGRPIASAGELVDGGEVHVVGAGGQYWPQAAAAPPGLHNGYNFVHSPLDNLTAPSERVNWSSRPQPNQRAHGAYSWPEQWQQHFVEAGGRMPQASAEVEATWCREDLWLPRSVPRSVPDGPSGPPSIRASRSRIKCESPRMPLVVC